MVLNHRKKEKKVSVITLGCSKNVYDSEVLMRQLEANDFEVSHDDKAQESSIVIVNTCGFIDDAKQESIDTILQFSHARKNGWIDKLYVTGCLSERYKDDLAKEIPEVDAYFGTQDMSRLLKTLKADYKKELLGERLLTTPGHYAYLKIAEGCDRPCAFCAIPLMRGKHRSTPLEDLEQQAEFLAKNGTRELILIAQDLTYYGLDIYGKRTLATLLDRLANVDRIKWIRLHYAYPTGFPMDIVPIINKHPNILPYLDIPLQHASTRMLKAMRRGISKEKTTALIQELREQIPGLTLRTTLISGFPGETLEDHHEMLQWIQEMNFDRLGVFTYSHEEDTHAYTLVDDVPEEEKERRKNEIMDVQAEISFEKNQKWVGEELEIVIDRVEKDFIYGRTAMDSPEVDHSVILPYRENVNTGDFINVHIMQADYFDLYGAWKSC